MWVGGANLTSAVQWDGTTSFFKKFVVVKCAVRAMFETARVVEQKYFPPLTNAKAKSLVTGGGQINVLSTTIRRTGGPKSTSPKKYKIRCERIDVRSTSIQLFLKTLFAGALRGYLVHQGRAGHCCVPWPRSLR